MGTVIEALWAGFIGLAAGAVAMEKRKGEEVGKKKVRDLA
jgi:hypothetical protein